MRVPLVGLRPLPSAVIAAEAMPIALMAASRR
jgi:hypothetical protein